VQAFKSEAIGGVRCVFCWIVGAGSFLRCLFVCGVKLWRFFFAFSSFVKYLYGFITQGRFHLFETKFLMLSSIVES
jgi:hypothetical protein